MRKLLASGALAASLAVTGFAVASPAQASVTSDATVAGASVGCPPGYYWHKHWYKKWYKPGHWWKGHYHKKGHYHYTYKWRCDKKH
ncbi:unnamed protein product [[Actinomadura] parvosata subsp. kistnae]|uniref:BcpO-related WXXGXW repeat protein n=2 Tax=Nonomuraea TaxID=83681 RepID=A0A1U9ZU12_9ACTN|nr:MULTISPECIES: hypothetical protein [unclassified Nonomuraea]AQZ61424.1 hypothetical protein BKM31_08005 [Nonomuraea sp. ATCC 55076]NJP88468.1 hypothetical protein [Nonomuraea sp. FMUSA5-5]SPL98115.1 unnamed protein product [Actinomadura parvosata subsp. kistnae]